MSEIASKKKKRNEFLISSAEKSIGYSTVFLSFYCIPIYSRQRGFFFLSLFFFFFFNLACTSQDFERCPKNLIICSVEQKYLMH